MVFIKTFKTMEEHSARHLGSGTLDVLATPAVIAFSENTCHEAFGSFLADEDTTVGTFIELSHIRASKIGEDVTVEVTINEKNTKKCEFTFEVKVLENTIASGTHTRAIVNKERFLNKL